MSVFNWVKGKLKIESGGDVAGVMNVTPDFKALVKDEDLIAAIAAVSAIIGTEATLAAISGKLDPVATEATLAAIANQAGLLATEATLADLKARGDLLGTEATLADLKARADLLGTEATLAALKARADLLGDQTTLQALKDRADLLGTEATLANVHARLLDLLGDAVAGPAANTLNSRLLAIHTRLNDETQRALIGVVRTSPFLVSADGTRGMPSMDERMRLRVTPQVVRLGPNQRLIRRYGSISTNSTGFVTLTNLTAVPGAFGLPAQNINYTPPADTRFLLLRAGIEHIDKNGTELAGLAVKAGAAGTRDIIHTACATASPTPRELIPPKEFAAGTAIITDVRVSGGTFVGFVWWEGIEEDLL